jgi:hypothetical protein
MTFRTISRFLPLQLALIFALATPLRAQPMTFATGSLIIPMDKDFQDSGMLAAFGLVDKLLHAGVRVNWCIQPGKAVGGTDFTASAKDSRTGAVITNHGYRGGPFVIDAADAAAAMPVVTAWQAARPTVAVHVATTQLAATRRLLLTASPRVAVLADGA